MSRAVLMESFGGPEALEVREVTEPHAGPRQMRIRVSVAGLNPVDWKIAASPRGPDEYGLSLPAGFGNDLAGVVDEVGEGVPGFAVGDRVFGGARGRAVADEGDTVLVGGAAGGVGVLVVQLARLAAARVVGTGAAGTADFLRSLGAEPVTYGDGLADRVRPIAPDGVTAVADLVGVETARAALDLGVSADRIATIAAADPPAGPRLSRRLRVPIPPRVLPARSALGA